ncbi:UNKNOWN [Stylonychia lemnae]|uniref:PHD-type domain-containing protein n=1 Tax=Stylonychia lemnae TaxID=5949 RepID=A0A078ALE3_STYLE|nr:UNKNOWN [Stylonychia lemnae]|eukprot:CDW83034.1 UNKNOWN [Stylonychia lemnae]
MPSMNLITSDPVAQQQLASNLLQQQVLQQQLLQQQPQQQLNSPQSPNPYINQFQVPVTQNTSTFSNNLSSTSTANTTASANNIPTVEQQFESLKNAYFNAKPLNLKQIASENMTQNPLNSQKCLACKQTCQIKSLLCCEMCLIQVHYECYGQSNFFNNPLTLRIYGINNPSQQGKLPTSIWICDRCCISIENEQLRDLNKMKCQYCQQTSGLMKMLDSEEKWVHYDCVMSHQQLQQQKQHQLLQQQQQLLNQQVMQ